MICLANESWHVRSQFTHYMTKRVDSGCHVTMYSNRWVSRIAAISEKKTKKSHHCACRGWCYAECSAVHFPILLWSMFCMACPSQPNDMLGACFCLVIHHDDWVGTSIACFHYTSFCVVLAWYHAQEWYIPLHHILRLSSKWHAWRCYHCLLFVHAIRDATVWKHTRGVFFSCNPPVYTRYCVTMSWAQFTRFHNAWLCCQAMCCICSVSAAQVVDDMLASHTPVHSWHGHRNDMLSAQYRCCILRAMCIVVCFHHMCVLNNTCDCFHETKKCVCGEECRMWCNTDIVCIFSDVSWNNNLPWRKKTPAYSVNRSAHIQSEELIMWFLNPRFAL